MWIWKLSVGLQTHGTGLRFVTEAVSRKCSVKKVFLKISQNSQENTCARVSFFIKLQAFALLNFIKKETLTQVFSCRLWEISKNTFCYRTPPVAVSVLTKNIAVTDMTVTENHDLFCQFYGWFLPQPNIKTPS